MARLFTSFHSTGIPFCPFAIFRKVFFHNLVFRNSYWYITAELTLCSNEFNPVPISCYIDYVRNQYFYFKVLRMIRKVLGFFQFGNKLLISPPFYNILQRKIKPFRFFICLFLKSVLKYFQKKTILYNKSTMPVDFGYYFPKSFSNFISFYEFLNFSPNCWLLYYLIISGF